MTSVAVSLLGPIEAENVRTEQPIRDEGHVGRYRAAYSARDPPEERPVHRVAVQSGWLDQRDLLGAVSEPPQRAEDGGEEAFTDSPEQWAWMPHSPMAK